MASRDHPHRDLFKSAGEHTTSGSAPAQASTMVSLLIDALIPPWGMNVRGTIRGRGLGLVGFPFGHLAFPLLDC